MKWNFNSVKILIFSLIYVIQISAKPFTGRQNFQKDSVLGTAIWEDAVASVLPQQD